jgi:hypothetical protein
VILEGRWTSKRESFGAAQPPMKIKGMTICIEIQNNVLFSLSALNIKCINLRKFFVIKGLEMFLGVELST